ncbi:hypothetical protein JX266_013451 [Neoarthrinium moseri]|nr:hypothetical protein JX266_013451 [Neoarthrinium moseri]
MCSWKKGEKPGECVESPTASIKCCHCKDGNKVCVPLTTKVRLAGAPLTRAVAAHKEGPPTPAIQELQIAVKKALQSETRRAALPAAAAAAADAADAAELAGRSVLAAERLADAAEVSAAAAVRHADAAEASLLLLRQVAASAAKASEAAGDHLVAYQTVNRGALATAEEEEEDENEDEDEDDEEDE